METFRTLNNPNPPTEETVQTQLKKIILQGEEQVKTFINDCMIMQKVPVNQKISKTVYWLKTKEKLRSPKGFAATLVNK